jgi:hypothetical protein
MALFGTFPVGVYRKRKGVEPRTVEHGNEQMMVVSGVGYQLMQVTTIAAARLANQISDRRNLKLMHECERTLKLARKNSKPRCGVFLGARKVGYTKNRN